MLRRPRAREIPTPRAVVEPPVLEAVVDVEALGRPHVPDESLFILGVEVPLFYLEQLEQRAVLPVGGVAGWTGVGGTSPWGGLPALFAQNNAAKSRCV